MWTAVCMPKTNLSTSGINRAVLILKRNHIPIKTIDKSILIGRFPKSGRDEKAAVHFSRDVMCFKILSQIFELKCKEKLKVNELHARVINILESRIIPKISIRLPCTIWSHVKNAFWKLRERNSKQFALVHSRIIVGRFIFYNRQSIILSTKNKKNTVFGCKKAFNCSFWLKSVLNSMFWRTFRSIFLGFLKKMKLLRKMSTITTFPRQGLPKSCNLNIFTTASNNILYFHVRSMWQHP